MQGGAAWQALRVWIYAAAAVLVGAWATPIVYNAGKALAEVSSQKETNGPLEWLADQCRGATFPAFFQVSLLLTAAVLLVPFLRGLPRDAAGGPRWEFIGPRGFRRFAVGFLQVLGMVLLLSAALAVAGVTPWNNSGSATAGIAARALLATLIFSTVQEIFFRGIVLGIFLRALRPGGAIALSALLFTLVRLLHPPPGSFVNDPDAWGTGFELLGKIAHQRVAARSVAGHFVPLLGIGCVLAVARLRTASLALPLGLAAGWQFSSALLGAFTGTPALPKMGMWGVLAAISTAVLLSTRPPKPDVPATSTP